ncbi:MAG: UDP-N-acetylmuramate dehydrogenase [Methylococcales bacterium]
MPQSDRIPCSHGDLLVDQPLANYCSWRVGGSADRLFRPRDRESLVAFLKELPAHEPVFWLGMGSNLLIRDQGIRGTVVNTRGRLNIMKIGERGRVYAEAGVLGPHLARFCSAHSYCGAEFLTGVPGTLGGALAMNAGAFDGETWTLIEEVSTVNRAGRCQTRNRDLFEIGYRHVSGPTGEYFLAAILKLEPGDGKKSRDTIKALLAKRAATQPLNLPSCGSVFRNPPNDYAARLIEASGLKGYAIGGAQVSEKHANFIVNKNRARASDIEALMQFVGDEVERKQGIRLILEVRIVGEPQLRAK